MLNVLFRRNQAFTLILLPLSVQAMAPLNTASALSLHLRGCQPPLPQTPESAAPAHQLIGPASAKVDTLVQRCARQAPSSPQHRL